MKKPGTVTATTLKKPARKRKPVKLEKLYWTATALNYFSEDAVQKALVKIINKKNMKLLIELQKMEREEPWPIMPKPIRNPRGVQLELPVDVSFKIKPDADNGNLNITLIPKYKPTRAKK